MITKAIIKQLNTQDNNHCLVFIPLLKKANDDEKNVTLEATFTTISGLDNIYKVNDVVYIGFEDDEYNHPVILGKLHTKKENSNEITTTVVSKASQVLETTRLPENTLIGDLNIKDVNKKAQHADDLANLIYRTQKSSSGGGKIDDVKVDGTSVVTDKVANIDLQPVRDSISAEEARAKAAEETLAKDLTGYVTLDTDQTITGKKRTAQILTYVGERPEGLPEGYEPAVVTLNGVKIDTGIKVSSLTLPTIIAEVKFLSQGDCDFFGTPSVSPATILFNINTQTGASYVRWGTAGSTYFNVFSWAPLNSGFNNITLQSMAGNSHSAYLNDGLIGEASYTASFSNAADIFIGQGRSNNASSSWKKFVIMDDLTKVFDGIAALETSTGNAGFYDAVSKTFKTVSGATGVKDESDYALASDLEGVYQKKLTAGTLIEILNDKISTTAEKNVIEGIKVDGDKLPLTEKIATLGKLSLKDEVAESDLNSTLLNKLNYITSVSSSFEVTDGNLDLKSVSTDLLENGAKDLILDAGGAS